MNSCRECFVPTPGCFCRRCGEGPYCSDCHYPENHSCPFADKVRDEEEEIEVLNDQCAETNDG